MNQKILLHPNLNLTASEFAKVWNASEYAKEYGQAFTSQQSESITFDIDILEILIEASVNIPVKILGDVIKEIIITKIKPKEPPKLVIKEVKDADGNLIKKVKEITY